jgi:hypothetical protein
MVKLSNGWTGGVREARACRCRRAGATARKEHSKQHSQAQKQQRSCENQRLPLEANDDIAIRLFLGRLLRVHAVSSMFSNV